MLCCGLFPLCSLDACVSASLCSRRMLLHEQLNRAWHACDQCARFDCRSARHCWRSTPFCMCSHPLLTSHDYSPCDTSISILYNMHANIMRALIVDLYAIVGAQFYSVSAVIYSSLPSTALFLDVHLSSFNLSMGCMQTTGAFRLSICMLLWALNSVQYVHSFTLNSLDRSFLVHRQTMGLCLA